MFFFINAVVFIVSEIERVGQIVVISFIFIAVGVVLVVGDAN